MTDKKNDQKVQEVLEEKDLDKVTGGRAELPARPGDQKESKKNMYFPQLN